MIEPALKDTSARVSVDLLRLVQMLRKSLDREHSNEGTARALEAIARVAGVNRCAPIEAPYYSVGHPKVRSATKVAASLERLSLPKMLALMHVVDTDLDHVMGAL